MRTTFGILVLGSALLACKLMNKDEDVQKGVIAFGNNGSAQLRCRPSTLTPSIDSCSIGEGFISGSHQLVPSKPETLTGVSLCRVRTAPAAWVLTFEAAGSLTLDKLAPEKWRDVTFETSRPSPVTAHPSGTMAYAYVYRVKDGPLKDYWIAHTPYKLSTGTFMPSEKFSVISPPGKRSELRNCVMTIVADAIFGPA
ncbi:MAG: hypothetical protein IPI67_08515 [Myxococcales bacterium]|nr:hypothetical protein [Myxococcales bacterium]